MILVACLQVAGAAAWLQEESCWKLARSGKRLKYQLASVVCLTIGNQG